MPRFLPVLFLLLSGVASAQVSDWQALQKYVHKQVTIQTQSGQFNGRLVRVEDERLFIEQDGSPALIQRAAGHSLVGVESPTPMAGRTHSLCGVPLPHIRHTCAESAEEEPEPIPASALPDPQSGPLLARSDPQAH